MPAELPKPEPPPSQVGPDTIKAMLALARLAPPGPLVEVGVYKGGSAWHLGELALEQGRDLWLFDTFAGIPFAGPHDSHKIGDFGDTDYAAVQRAIPHAKLVMGIFPESALGPRYFPRRPVAFAHLDCDQERSYRDALRFLVPRMAKGGFLWLDDAPCLPGAERAALEVFERTQINLTEGKWWIKL